MIDWPDRTGLLMSKVAGDLSGRQINIGEDHQPASRMLKNLRAPASLGPRIESLATLEAEALERSNQFGEGRGLFTVEVALKPVPNSLVQEDAWPAGSQGDIHLPGGCRFGREVHKCDSQRLSGGVLPMITLD